MFRNLSVGQWVLFFALTFFTIFGGFLYVAVEAHYNRADRAFAASADGQTYAVRQSIVKPEPPRTRINWNNVLYVWLVLAAFGLGIVVVGGVR